jgi:hypothetical protein
VFEALLSNAFAVQESGLDRHSLAALVEIQRFLGREQLDLDREMQMVADRTCKLFRASGVAIALLEANELVYRAGAGISANDVGRHVSVVLNIASSQRIGREILRVENAETDRRIEAEICRQFGATSLLILPICKKHVLVGVLQVLFERPHSFRESEICFCRLMVNLLEEVISQGPRKQKVLEPELVGTVEVQRRTQQDLNVAKAPVHTLPTPSSILDQRTSNGPGSRDGGSRFVKLQAKQPPSFLAVRQIKGSQLWASFKVTFASMGHWTRNKASLRFAAALSAAFVLGLMICFSYSIHSKTSTRASAVPPSGEYQDFATVKSSFAKTKPGSPRNGRRDRSTDLPGFRRVQVSPNEVDYLAEDVTIRRFTVTSAPPPIRSGVREVNFGDDVTVRYFAKAAVTIQSPNRASEISTNTKRR